MNNLWDYLTQPSRANKPIDYGNYVDETLYNATAVPRFIANTGKSVYDSFKRGMANPNVEDAFNVAGAVMAGGMPGIPKGNSPSTLGMAFRTPKDIVYSTNNPNVFADSRLKNLASIYDKYFAKSWGTENDAIVKHLDKGKDLPRLPWELPDLQVIGDFEPNNLAGIRANPDAFDLDFIASHHNVPIASQTPGGLYYELTNDRLADSNVIDKKHYSNFKGLLDPKTISYLMASPDSRVIEAPQIRTNILRSQVTKLPGDISRMSLSDVLQHAANYDARMAQELAKAPVEKLHEFDDGHYWTQLKTQAQREAESEAMGNSTRLSMHDGKELYSLRDKNGKSILTASRQPNAPFFDEVKSRFNKDDILSALYYHHRWEKDVSKGAYYNQVKALNDVLGMQHGLNKNRFDW